VVGNIGLIPVRAVTGKKTFSLIDEEIKRHGQNLPNNILQHGLYSISTDRHDFA
jgi:hypothetical protein